jgi:uncharacterized protein YbaR (Trm112 family)
MDPELLAILADPETHAPLTRATGTELAALRDAITRGDARRRDGSAITMFDGALLPPDRRVAYLIEAGVPNLVIEERVELARPL